MKVLAMLVIGSAVLLGGCASTDNSTQPAVSSDDSYVALGSAIPKKKSQQTEENKVNLQQLENDRVMNNGTNNGPGVR